MLHPQLISAASLAMPVGGQYRGIAVNSRFLFKHRGLNQVEIVLFFLIKTCEAVMSSSSGVKQRAEGCLWECWLDYCSAGLTFNCAMPCFFHRTSAFFSETDEFEMLRLL